MKTEKQKMLAGELYVGSDPALAVDSARAIAWCGRYNASFAATIPERQALLRELFGAVGADANLRPPFFCDYGYNITLGDGVFMNFGCTILDVCAVTIGDLTQIGPGVQILTADHPRDPAQRRAMLESGRPISIGRNVWIGAARADPARRHDRRRRDRRRRQRGDARRAGRGHGRGEPGTGDWAGVIAPPRVHGAALTDTGRRSATRSCSEAATPPRSRRLRPYAPGSLSRKSRRSRRGRGRRSGDARRSRRRVA